VDTITGSKVLVVDDDPLNQEMMVTILEDRGYTVFSADDGDSGLDLLDKEQDIRVTVTDIMMPNREGISFIRAIRSRRPTMKIIAVTGAVNYQKIFSTAQDFGADVTIKKPFNIDEFADKVDELVLAVS
jgi:CheY-like chemotaxis protein